MADETIAPSYSFRRNILTGERRFYLGADAIFWEDKHRRGSVAYADVQMLRLYDFFVPYAAFSPSRVRVQRCLLQSRSGAKLALQSVSHGAWGKWEDRSIAYVPFVRDLIGRIATASPQASLIGGLSRPLYLLYAVSLVALPLLLVVAILDLASGWSRNAGLLLLLWIVPVGWFAAWTTIRHGRQRRLDPQDLPDGPAGS